jgi:hypothetical protein
LARIRDYRAPEAIYHLLVREIGAERVFAPRLLNVSRQPPREIA